ncbi:hypothetical protein BSKO_10287 [Bryopsis sp. KO-2023]|nr:hypothetical protein BSKO_10287 [Bryopsis sp. KO-2023]
MLCNAGILAIRVYTPANYIRQESLEQHDEVEGKYTKGMGLAALSCCWSNEDSVSMAMTVVDSLLEEYQIDTTTVGKLYVASEGRIDSSKSISSHLRSLFVDNDTIEGVDLVHACYAMSSGLLASLDYVESPHWDGRYALVVGSDIALYPPGSEHRSARATGGCGAVAILIGSDAPLVIDRSTLSIFSMDSHEFTRPISNWPFPVYDGLETNDVFFLAVAKCSGRYLERAEISEFDSEGLDSIDFFVSHAPYPRIVQKAFVRMALLDLAWKSQKGKTLSEMHQKLIQQMPPGDQTIPEISKDLEKQCMGLFESHILSKVIPGLTVSQECGNCYTGSLYGGLASLVEFCGSNLEGKRCLMFAFGSGTMASMFVITGRAPAKTDRFNLASMSQKVGLKQMLQSRREVDVAQFEKMLASHHSPSPIASGSPEGLRAGTYYVHHFDGLHRRFYQRACRQGSADQDM